MYRCMNCLLMLRGIQHMKNKPPISSFFLEFFFFNFFAVAMNTHVIYTKVANNRTTEKLNKSR